MIFHYLLAEDRSLLVASQTRDMRSIWGRIITRIKGIPVSQHQAQHIFRTVSEDSSIPIKGINQWSSKAKTWVQVLIFMINSHVMESTSICRVSCYQIKKLPVQKSTLATITVTKYIWKVVIQCIWLSFIKEE